MQIKMAGRGLLRAPRPHEKIRALLRDGRNAEAIAKLRPILRKNPKDADGRKLLFDALFQNRNWEEALEVARSLAGEMPEAKVYGRWIVNTLSNLKRYDETVSEATRYMARQGEDADTLNTLKIALFYLGRTQEAVGYGQRVMEMRDREVCAAVRDVVAPPAGRRGKDIIAFTLWGGAAIYSYGAMINLLLAQRHFPAWTCRFYVDDSVPSAVVAFLEREGGDVVGAGAALAGVPGYFRRFMPFDDETVTHVLVRDCDSRLSQFEAGIVSEWLASGCSFHVIRDHVLHNDLMLAGLWGGRADCGLSMAALLKEYFSFGSTNKYGHDQRMLARMVWPRIRGACLVHDKFYRLPDVRTIASLPTGSHLGAGYQNLESVCKEAERLGIPRIH